MSVATLELLVVGEYPTTLDLAPLGRAFGALVAAADQLELPEGTINLAFVDDETMRTMNREYSGHDYATDVLSFNYLESGEAIEGVVGEMVISLETAQRQADAAGTNLAEEVALLAVHGALHVAGYDHQDEAGREHMQLLQRELMATAGLNYREFIWQD